MKITVVYDNETTKSALKPDWGFSCFIENKKNHLSDTGANSDILLSNMKVLGIKPEDIDIVFLSHNHWDHVDGLNALVSLNTKIKVYHPDFSLKPKEVIENITTTGMLSGIEQSLIINTDKGLVVVTGCSHPGLENILDVARKFGKIYAVIGGFHGFDKFDILKDVELFLPCHCTQHKKEICRLYPENCSVCGAGKIVEI